MALKIALQSPVAHIHYADMDRLLRWVETRPEEWREATLRIADGDYLVMGRSAAAYATHPQALVKTEEISNHLISRLVGGRWMSARARKALAAGRRNSW